MCAEESGPADWVGAPVRPRGEPLRGLSVAGPLPAHPGSGADWSTMAPRPVDRPRAVEGLDLRRRSMVDVGDALLMLDLSAST